MPSCPQLAVVLLLVSTLAAGSPKPKIKVASDGFPTGQQTPEGAAADLARAFIFRDAAGFRAVAIRPYGTGQNRADYEAYLKGVENHLKQAKGKLSPDDPKKITKVFAARHLTRQGPASWGYAAFGFQDVMFVDVDTVLHNGHSHLKRTLVIKDKDGKWYAQPVSDVSPLLSQGLYDESPSVRLFSDAYEVEH